MEEAEPTNHQRANHEDKPVLEGIEVNHPLYALLQSGPPPLDTDILLLTKHGAWAIGQCSEYHFGEGGLEVEILFNDQAWSHQVEVGKDRWMVLPSSSEGP